MSLEVNDPRSRGRSKSPSGRLRDRSRSRDNRGPSPAPVSVSVSESSKKALVKKYYDSDSADEATTSTSRHGHGDSRRKSSSYRDSSSRYDVSDSGEDDKYRRSERRRDDYYHSDSGDQDVRRVRGSHAGTGSGASRAKYSSERAKDGDYTRSSRRRHESQYDHRSDDSYSESNSDDEHLAYGDVPPRSQYRPSSPPRGSSSKYRVSTSSAARYDEPHAPGSHPSYARPEQYRYAEPAQYAPATPANYFHARQPSYTGTPTSSAPPIDWASVPECERPGFVPPSPGTGQLQSIPGAFPSAGSAYPPAPSPGNVTSTYPMPQYANLPQQNVYGQPGYPQPVPTTNAHVPSVMSPTHHRQPSTDAPSMHGYAQPPQWQYAQVDPHIKYTSKNPPKEYTQSGANQFIKPYTQSTETQFMEITPGGGRAPATGRPHSLSVSSGHNLTVAGANVAGSRPPASPLLEPYKGTYQSISPMPSPIVIPSIKDDDLSDLDLADRRSHPDRKRKSKNRSDGDKDKDKDRADKRSSKKESHSKHARHDSQAQGRENMVLISPASGRKKVTFYDASEDARALHGALSHSRSVDTKPLISILPRLSSDEILTLRKEYKNHAKVGGKGINIAKFIRLKLGTGSFGKVCYATALGRWESEAYWANCYYQSGTSRRELLIESLMGRTNAEIREIKDCFRDSRYGDSLEKCMKSELKADKFRTAILLALEENRQNEREPIDARLVQQDVQELHRSLVSRDGGETAMIFIIVLRSDSHLREVLRLYEKTYGQNFARAMIDKSRNLVGETLAHILNGAINRPMRDALLLHQALRESRTGKERSELLISRLVRLHWEPRHLELVKAEFRKRYNERLEEAIAQELLTSSSGSDWGEFCIELARSSGGLVGRG